MKAQPATRTTKPIIQAISAFMAPDYAPIAGARQEPLQGQGEASMWGRRQCAKALALGVYLALLAEFIQAVKHG